MEGAMAGFILWKTLEFEERVNGIREGEQWEGQKTEKLNKAKETKLGRWDAPGLGETQAA